MLTDIAKQQLRKAGWYEGRKIDLSKYEEAYAKIGCEMFPAARKFLEEYGDLHFYDKCEALDLKKGYYINESSTELVYCCSRRDNELEEMVENLFGQKTLRVGLIDCGNIYISISEDGRFFVNWYFNGLWAENSDQLWNEYYGEEYGRASWEDLKAGKGRTMYKKKAEKYL